MTDRQMDRKTAFQLYRHSTNQANMVGLVDELEFGSSTYFININRWEQSAKIRKMPDI